MYSRKAVDSEQDMDLMKATQKQLYVFLEARIEQNLLSELLKRPGLAGAERIVLPLTKDCIKGLKKDSPIRGAAITILCDAIPCPHRLHAAGLTATPACDFCDCEDADSRAYHMEM